MIENRIADLEHKLDKMKDHIKHLEEKHTMLLDMIHLMMATHSQHSTKHTYHNTYRSRSPSPSPRSKEKCQHHDLIHNQDTFVNPFEDIIISSSETSKPSLMANRRKGAT